MNISRTAKRAYCIILLFVNFSFVHSVVSQKVAVEKSLIDSLLSIDETGNEESLHIGYNLCNIYKLNKIKRVLNHKDTITVNYFEGNYHGTYNDCTFPLNAPIKKKRTINVWGSSGCQWDYLSASTCDSDSTYTEITLTNKNEFKEDPLIIVENYLNGQPYGEYKEVTMSNKLIIHGYYQLKDSIYIDTFTIFNYETYEEQIVIKEQNKIGVMCGEWITKNILGETLEIIQKENCR